MRGVLAPWPYGSKRPPRHQGWRHNRRAGGTTGTFLSKTRSTGLSSGERGGRGSRVMLAGMRNVFASCHPA